MKVIKLSFILAVAVMATIGIGTTSYAFHDGGVAPCESCHTMHNSYMQGAMAGLGSSTVGAYGTANPLASKQYLLRGSDPSSTCLNCHESSSAGSFHVSTPLATVNAQASQAPIQMGPAGDFAWVKVSTTGTSTTSTPDRHGHNIIAADFGYVADATNIVAPGSGGTGYAGAQLNCVSCHNPHSNWRRIDENGTLSNGGLPIIGSGSYDTSIVPTAGKTAVGVYRFLGGTGYAPKSYSLFPFTNQVPMAVAPSIYNRSEATSDTAVAYGSGMSLWCVNCHPQMNGVVYNPGGSGHPHPTDRQIGPYSTYYIAYIKTGNLTGNGVTSGGYSSLVPVERDGDAATITALKTIATDTAYAANKISVSGNSEVFCLTCHRAHASGFQSMMRWDMQEAMTDTAGNYTLQSGQTNTFQVQAAYYQRPSSVFAIYQRALCNKCHYKD